MKTKAIVIREFRDTHDFAKIHKVGEDVSKFGKDRLIRLKNLGYVKIEEEEGKEKVPKKEAE